MSLFFVFNYFLTHQKGIKISDLADVRFPVVDFNCTPNVVPFILVKLLALALHRESPSCGHTEPFSRLSFHKKETTCVTASFLYNGA